MPCCTHTDTQKHARHIQGRRNSGGGWVGWESGGGGSLFLHRLSLGKCSRCNNPNGLRWLQPHDIIQLQASTLFRLSLTRGAIVTPMPGAHAGWQAEFGTQRHDITHPPSRQAGGLLCASSAASAGRVSRGGGAGPAWAAPSGTPRTWRATAARSTTAWRGAGTSWSRRTDLAAAAAARGRYLTAGTKTDGFAVEIFA